MHFSVEQAGDQATAVVVELQGRDEFVGFGPAGHSSRIDSPQPNDLVCAAARNTVVLGDVEYGAGDNILVSQHLDWSPFV